MSATRQPSLLNTKHMRSVSSAGGGSISPSPAAHTRGTMIEEFEAYRPLLFSIAYRMLGSAMEAEDVVQEAFLRFQAAPKDTIRSLKPFLTTIVTRLCLDHMKSARAQRETYVGQWLPEPIRTDSHEEWITASTPENRVTAYESISMAFLVLLESLTPVERAVFLLREVFEFDYAEIARIVEKEEAACRQAFHRAHQHVAAHRSRFKASLEARERLTYQFLQACAEGSVEAFTEILAEDVAVHGDGGGKMPASRRPIVGRDKVALFFTRLVRLVPKDARIEIASVNGAPAIVIHVETGIYNVLMFETDGTHIHRIFSMLNPSKMTHI